MNLTQPKFFGLGDLGKLPGQIAAEQFHTLSNWLAQANGMVMNIGEGSVNVCQRLKKFLKNMPSVENAGEASCRKFCQNNGTEAAALSEGSCIVLTNSHKWIKGQ